ncbi:MAG: hypothetical protein E7050_02790 [Lentisphaerae bacterium]|nr:hypothetical protein [Lentisphaerota bacterium]
MKKICGILCGILLFLLPVKLGGLAVMPESGGFFPEFFIDWLFITWHPHSLAYFSCALLLLTLIAYGAELSGKMRIFVLLWGIVPSLAVIPGILRGDNILALGEISLLSSCGALIAAAGIILKNRPHCAGIFAGSVVAGGIITAFYGWYQHLVVLDEIRRFAAEQEAMGIPVSEAMQLKLTDPRIFSTLASSNILASFMLMLLVISFYLSGKWSERFTPPRQAKYIFRIFFAGLFLSVLFLTRSRSALFCPVAAGLIALFSHPGIKLRWKISGIAAGIIIVIAGLFYAVHHGRGVASMGERVDYWHSCAVLCKEYPLTGAGWGGFFRTHMQIKLSDVDESARDPHNIVASFASQCGIPAGLLMLTVLLYPLIILWKHRFSPDLRGTVFWCGTIFTLHSLIDCDWQIPAMISIMGVLYCCVMPEENKATEESSRRSRMVNYAAAAMLISAGFVSSYYYLAGDHALSRLQDKLNPPTPEIRAKLAIYTVEDLAKQAEKFRPDQAVIPMILGDWYLRLEALDQAEIYFLKALETDPVRPAAYARLARIAMLRGEREKAEGFLARAHKLFPKNPDYLPENFFADFQK